VENIGVLFLILIPVILLLFILSRINKNQWQYVQKIKTDDAAQLSASRKGVRSTAIVVSRRDNILPHAGGYAKVTLELEIQVPQKSSLKENTTWLVAIDAIDKVEVGKRVPVIIKNNRTHEILPDAEWAKPWIFD
jgi:hypothetical protein